MRVLITLLFLTVAAHAQEIVINNGIPRNAADTRYVNSPVESVAQTFTSSVTVNGALEMRSGTVTFSQNGDVGTSGMDFWNGTQSVGSIKMNFSNDLLNMASDGALRFSPGDTHAVTVNTNGNIFIGSTPTPATNKLHVNGGVTASSITLTQGLAGITWADGSVSTTAAAGSLAFSGSGTANTLAKFTGATAVGDSSITDNGTTVAVPGPSFSVGGSTLVVSAGKVGVGATPTPTGGQLQLSAGPISATTSDGADNINVALCGGGGNAIARGACVNAFGNEASGNEGNLYINSGNVASSRLIFTTNGTEKMTVANGGNVGIGTTAPDSKLHISSGEFKSDGNLSAMAGWTIGASRGVYARNATVGTISSGTVVTFSTLYNNTYGDIAITTNAANGTTPVGTIFTVAGCAAGALCQVCTEGLCPARLDSGSACANTNDAVISGTEVGRAKCTAAPDAATVHWRELGQPAIWTALNGDVIWIFAHRN